jgi:hypothetical protein
VRLIGSAAFVTVVSIATVPVYLGVEPRYRPLAVRMFVALIAAVTLPRVLKMARSHIEHGASSAFHVALDRPRPVARLDRSFLQLRDEVHFSTMSARYFEQGLWPRLVALRAASSTRAAEELSKPPARRFPRRGPTRAALADVVAALEREP